MSDALAGILETKQAERLATGFVFTEGPVWHPDGFYYFVDIRRSNLHKLTPGKEPELVRSNTGEGNGTTFDLQGRLVICEGGNRRVTRWNGIQSEVLMDRFEGKRLNRPNDVVCKSDGSIYFTDPGLRVPLAERELAAAGVYRIAPDGTTSLVADCEYPNGLAFSPDERVLYVANTSPHLRRHVVGRDRRRARRHEGRRRGPCLLHGSGRHVGLRPRRHEARDHPHPGSPREPRLRRSGSPDPVLHRPHVGLHHARQGPGAAGSLVQCPLEAMINFGTFLLMQSPSARSSKEIYARGVEMALAAETLGFNNVWLAEHHFSTYGYLSRPAQLATYIAAKTTRIRVGTAVIVVPLHHPLVIAEEIATLDLLSGGRLDVGLGRGYQPYEFERFGLELESGRARWEESIDILLKAFEGQPFSYDGKLFKIPETTVFPQPLQQPRPPIWITAQSPESVEAAVRRGFNVLTGGFGVPIERMAEFRRLFDRLVGEFKPPHPLRVGVQRAVYVAESQADARAAAEEARWNMRVTLSLRNQYERVERGRAIPVPAPRSPIPTTCSTASWSSARRIR